MADPTRAEGQPQTERPGSRRTGLIIGLVLVVIGAVGMITAHPWQQERNGAQEVRTAVNELYPAATALFDAWDAWDGRKTWDGQLPVEITGPWNHYLAVSAGLGTLGYMGFVDPIDEPCVEAITKANVAIRDLDLEAGRPALAAAFALCRDR